MAGFKNRPILGFFSFAFALAVFAFFVQAYAAVPQIINYQGRLEDANGNLQGGSSGANFDFKFSIWNVSSTSSGTRLWPTSAPASTTHKVTSGVFDARIGDAAQGFSALTLDFNTSTVYYLQIDVYSTSTADFETLSPRQAIVAAGFAINADTVDGAHAGISANNVLELDPSGGINLPNGSSTFAGAVALNSTLNVGGITTLAGFTFTNATGTGNLQIATLLATGASSLQGFTFTNATGTGNIQTATANVTGQSTFASVSSTNFTASGYGLFPMLYDASGNKYSTSTGGSGNPFDWVGNGTTLTASSSYNLVQVFGTASSTELRTPSGTIATFTFTNATGTTLMLQGLAGQTANLLDIASSSGSLYLSVSNAGQFLATTTLAAASPAYSFLGDPDTGAFESGANEYGITTGGTQRININSTDIVFTPSMRGPSGLAGTPTYSFSAGGNSDNGMFLNNTDNIGFSAGGVMRLSLTATTFQSTVPTTISATNDATLLLTGSPAAKASSSLVQLGPNIIQGGSASGTFLGANPETWNGSFIDFQVNSSTQFRVSATGTVFFAGNVSSTGVSFTNASGTNISVTGYGTFPTLNSTNAALTDVSSTNITASGYGTFPTLNSTNAALTNVSSTNITASGFLQGASLDISGQTTLAAVSSTNLTASGFLQGGSLNISGQSTLASVSSTNITASGYGIIPTLSFTNASGTNISASGFLQGGSLTLNNESFTDLTGYGLANTAGVLSVDLASVRDSDWLGSGTTLAASSSYNLVQVFGTASSTELRSPSGTIATLAFTNASGTNLTASGFLQGATLDISGQSTLASVSSTNITASGYGVFPELLFTNATGTALTVSSATIPYFQSFNDVATSAFKFVDMIGNGAGGVRTAADGDYFSIISGTATSSYNKVLWVTGATPASNPAVLYVGRPGSNSASTIQSNGIRTECNAAGAGCTAAWTTSGRYMTFDNESNSKPIRFEAGQNAANGGLEFIPDGRASTNSNTNFKFFKRSPEPATVSSSALFDFAHYSTTMVFPYWLIMSKGNPAQAGDLPPMYDSTTSTADFWIDNTGGIFSTSTLTITSSTILKGTLAVGTTTQFSATTTLTVCAKNNCTVPDTASTTDTVAFFASTDGSTTANSIIARGSIYGGQADIGEFVSVVGPAENYDAGDLLSISIAEPGKFEKSAVAYDEKLAGIVTKTAGLVAGGGEDGRGSIIMALAGRLPIKITGQNGPIAVGDYLAASDVSGYAMKATEQGKIIAIAMEPFSGTTSGDSGKILAFIAPQWYAGSAGGRIGSTLQGSGTVIQGGTSGAINNYNLDPSAASVLNDLTVKKLTIGSADEPVGFTIFDVRTKSPYCVQVEDGALKTMPGACSAATSTVGGTSPSPPASTSTTPISTSTPPTSPAPITTSTPPTATSTPPAPSPPPQAPQPAPLPAAPPLQSNEPSINETPPEPEPATSQAPQL